MSKILIAAAVSVLLLPIAAHAQNVEVGARISTLGAGVEVGGNLNDHVRIRGLVNGWDVNHDNTTDSIRYNGKLKLGSAGVQVDYRPAASGNFYVTAGLYANRNRVRETAMPTGNTQIGSVTYTPAEIGTLTGRARYKDTAPYLGLGWDVPTGPVSFNFELGAYFQGHPSVTLTSDGTLSGNAAYQDQLEQERLKLRHDLDKASTWPVVALGVRYQF